MGIGATLAGGCTTGGFFTPVAAFLAGRLGDVARA